MGGIVILYKYHRSEVEAGNEGLPGLQQLLQTVDNKCGTKLSPAAGRRREETKKTENFQPEKVQQKPVSDEQLSKPESERQSIKQTQPPISQYIDTHPVAVNQTEAKLTLPPPIQKEQAPTPGPAWVPQTKPAAFSADKDMIQSEPDRDRDKVSFLFSLSPLI